MNTNGFMKAMTTDDARTENGMPTNSTSSSDLLDLFFKIGASRALPERQIEDMFCKAYKESPRLTRKLMMYNRDVRGGQGERRSFRIMLRKFASEFSRYLTYAEINKFISLIPEYGRWDDVLCLVDTRLEAEALSLIRANIENPLCAKWMPREGKAHADWYYALIKFLHITPKMYRKLLSRATRVVETQMCKNQWEEIKFEHVPSVAHNKYRTAFYKHTDKYAKYIEAVLAGKAKINASAIFPHDIVKKVMASRQDSKATQAQWDNLPDYVAGGGFIPVVDVSGSMYGLPLQVATALGIYLAERNKSAFRDAVITFSATPEFIQTSGTLGQRIAQVQSSRWGMNTNIEAVFKMILLKAVENHVPREDMPEYIIILSDMQFDACSTNYTHSAMQMIEDMYARSGYKRPNIVFWNLRASTGIPVKYDKYGTAVVSGFSPTVMTNVLHNEINPATVMLKTLNAKRYSNVP